VEKGMRMLLLQVEAFRSNVLCPNKHLDANDRLFKGRLLATETYIGGKVEAIESGVFRSDIPCKFTLQPEGYQMLIDRCASRLCHMHVCCGLLDGWLLAEGKLPVTLWMNARDSMRRHGANNASSRRQRIAHFEGLFQLVPCLWHAGLITI
jgi:hypothetical protein